MYTLVFVVLCIHQSFATPTGFKKVPYETYMQDYNSDEVGRVIQGTPAAEGQFPYAVALFHKNQFICTAQKIDNCTVLTAAHCVVLEGQSTNARDFHGVMKAVAHAAGRKYSFSELYIHDDYNTKTFENDIAIFKIDPKDYDDSVEGICISGRNDTSYEQHPNAVVLGWGRTNRFHMFPSRFLTFGNVKVHEHNSCKTKWNVVDGGVNDDMICEDSENKQGACNGDSGGPMAFLVGKQGVRGHQDVIIGIGSFVLQTAQYPHCATAQYPAVFTRVSSFTDWIRNHSCDALCVY